MRRFTPPRLSGDTARFSLLGVLIAAYMLAGAGVFSLLERPGELLAQRLWECRLRDFSRRHHVSPEDLRALLRHHEEANPFGVRTDRRRERWDFPGAFYFVGTVVSTIGFGMTAPSTAAGKVLLVLYGLPGCSATLLFFNLFLERVMTALSRVMCWCHHRRSVRRDATTTGPRAFVHAQTKEEDERRGDEDEWKPSVYCVTLVLFVAALLVACGAAALYAAVEGWGYGEALYFCFVAFTTLGFGDLVSCQGERHGANWGYQAANCLLMLLGVCCTYSLFSVTAVVVRQALDGMLRACRGRAQPGSPPGLSCFCGSDAPWCFFCEDGTRRRRQVQTVGGLGDTVRPVFPSNASRCFCADAEVETVCHGDTDGGTAGERGRGDRSLRKDVFSGPLPM